MSNIKLILIVFLIFYIYAIKSQTTENLEKSINEVKSTYISECLHDNDCPSNSRGCLYNFCYYKFYCINSNCISATVYDFNKNFTNKIVNICSQEAFNEKKCSTSTCKSNSDCISNNCIKGTCMSNPSAPIVLCSNEYDHGVPFIKCSKTAYEKCNNNNECFSENCTKDKYCSKNYDYSEQDKSTILFLLKAVIGLLILIIISVIISKIVEHCLYKEEYIEEEYINEENYMEEVKEMKKEDRIVEQNDTLKEEKSNNNDNTIIKEKNEVNIKEIKVEICENENESKPENNNINEIININDESKNKNEINN